MAHWERLFGCSHSWLSQIRDIGRYVEKSDVDTVEQQLRDDASFIDPVFKKGRKRKGGKKDGSEQRWHGAGKIVEKLSGIYGGLDSIAQERKVYLRQYEEDD